MSKYNQISFCFVITIKTGTMILRCERKTIRMMCCILLSMCVKLVCNSNEEKNVEPMLYTTVILKVTQNENSWAEDDLICFVSDFRVIRKQDFEQKH
jgi:hypothetical protein